MTLSQVLLWVGVATAATQFYYARKLDQSLPISETLPAWGKFGPGMLKRDVALYMYGWLQLLVTGLLVLPTIFDGSEAMQEITGKKLALFCTPFLLMPLWQASQVPGLRRWVKGGQPRLAPQSHVNGLSTQRSCSVFWLFALFLSSTFFPWPREFYSD